MKKIIRTLVVSLFILIATATLSHASAPPAIYLDGNEITASLSGALIGGTSYIPLKAVAEEYGGSLTWEQNTRTARYNTNGLEVIATVGDTYILANGRALPSQGGIILHDGRIMLPSRVIAEILCGDVVWDGTNRSVHITSGEGYITGGEDFYDKDSLYWLSRIISAESRGEPFEGQIAVGNVILNRVSHPSYPDTIEGVVFDDKYAVQFEPVSNRTIYDDPAEISVIAAKLCLEGLDLASGSIYFYNPNKSQSTWFNENCQYIMTIGGHAFYS